jgi:hypothetical protein
MAGRLGRPRGAHPRDLNDDEETKAMNFKPDEKARLRATLYRAVADAFAALDAIERDDPLDLANLIDGLIRDDGTAMCDALASAVRGFDQNLSANIDMLAELVRR